MQRDLMMSEPVLLRTSCMGSLCMWRGHGLQRDLMMIELAPAQVREELEAKQKLVAAVRKEDAATTDAPQAVRAAKNAAGAGAKKLQRLLTEVRRRSLCTHFVAGKAADMELKELQRLGTEVGDTVLCSVDYDRR